ncbi:MULTISPECIES: hypothetical protein [unclassified Haematospirillum]|uniref:hypothetical protein n=1 Tax=unclassified Haematospirillum TaxID=2622088 RepID=UPI00143CA66C|nr:MULTISPECIES: hypothetical protein [unclassified Haematospirillum]NKD55063.1 hypothetical protein [Haematospirillum sp. H4890]NKD75316.1 hypothetical protein [Haematospirillum sp. H4485]NKD87590.1 hypothetical protein [Haematospirillum sp. 15-248]
MMSPSRALVLCRQATAITFSMLSLALAGCFGKDTSSPTCPDVRIDKDTASLTRFRNDRGQDLTDIVFQSELVDFSGDCGYDAKTDSMDIRMKVLFAVSKGPAASEETGTFQYFVAIPAFFPDTAGKQVFPVTFRYPDGNVPTMMIRDTEVRINLPLKGRNPADTPVYVGFQLEPHELHHNRRPKTR